MLGYFLPEIFLLFSLMANMQKEILIGLFDVKEDQIETIKQAMARCVKCSYNEIYFYI